MMSDVTATRINARVIGIVRGREIDAPAALELDENAIVIDWATATPWRLAFDGLEGVAAGATQLTLYLTSGDVLELHGDESLRQLTTQLLDRACTMPELTRGLRALGSRRGALGNSHDAWFAPLLAARRSIAGVSDPLRQVALVDSANLAASMRKTIAQLAAIQAPTEAAAQRAIEAVLEEAAEPLFVAIARLELAADALRGSALDTRLSDWRRWVEAFREVFVAADGGWRKVGSKE